VTNKECFLSHLPSIVIPATAFLSLPLVGRDV
jgi:hypothetical protein